MVLGDSMSILLELEVDISQLAKLKVAREQIDQFQRSTSRSINKMSGESRKATGFLKQMGVQGSQSFAQMAGTARMTISTMNRTSSSISRISTATKKARAGLAKMSVRMKQLAAQSKALIGNLQGARMAMLGLMFTGLNMAFLFGLILFLSPRVAAGFTMIKSALRLIAIEAGKMALPVLRELANWIRNLDDGLKKLAAKISLVLTVVGIVAMLAGALGGALLTVGGYTIQLVMTMGQLILSLGRLIPYIKAIGAWIYSTAIPAFLSLSVSIMGVTVPIWVIIAAVAALVAVFFKFESIRKAVAAGLAQLYQSWKDMGNLLVWLGQSALNQTMIGLMKAKKFMLQLEMGVKSLANTIIEKAVGAFNQLISAVNSLAKADPTGTIPTLEKLGDPEGFDLGSTAADIDEVSRSIKRLERAQGEINSDFLRRARKNERDANNIESSLKDTFRANKDLSIGDLIGGSSVSQRGINRDIGGGGSGQKVEKNVENNYSINEPKIDNELDIDDIMDRIEDRQERDQRRQSNLL